MDNLNFKEIQQFRNRSFWIFLGFIILFLIGIFGFGFVKQIILGKPFGTKPASDLQMILVTIFVYLISGGLFMIFYFAKLTTFINQEGISVRFIPFRNKNRLIPWDQIEKVFVRKYDPIKEYGGFGFRFGFKGGIAYNVSGMWGIQIILNNGKKILIGTQKPEEIRNLLKKIKLEKYNQ